MRALILAACVFVAVPVHAATYYVATTGNDGNPGTIGSPWLTPQKAATTAVAGDVVYFRAGTYTQDDILPANSGTAGNPITFIGYPGETAILDGGWASGSGVHPVFDIDGPDYITIDGLTIQHGSTANIYVGHNNTSTNITIQNCRLLDFAREDNAASIYINPNSDDLIITNNVIKGVIGSGFPASGFGIVLFQAGDVSITYNTIGDPANLLTPLVQGIYYKHNLAGSQVTTVTGNVIVNTSSAGLLWVMHDATISNNLFWGNGSYGIKVYEEGGNCAIIDSRSNSLLHNTMIGATATSISAGVFLQGPSSCPNAIQSTLVKNNVVDLYGSTNRGYAIAHDAGVAGDLTGIEVSYSLGYDPTNTNAATVLTPVYALTALPVTITSSNNIQAVPTFQDAANRDYRLTAGSNGHNAASDGQDMGAYTSTVTCIGATADPYPAGCASAGATTGPIRLRTRPGLLE